ncbi:MAG: release factor glutamine methyltransferase, partial [Kiritimatiellia bacterium]
GESFDLIVSNPPYIARDEMLELEPQIRSFEPETALLGGENGAELMARLVPQAFTALRASGRLVLEIGENQTKDVSELLADAGFGEIAVRPDLAGKPRMAHGLKTWPTE